MPRHQFAQPEVPIAIPTTPVITHPGRRRRTVAAALVAVAGLGGLGMLVGPGIAAAGHRSTPHRHQPAHSGSMAGIIDPSSWYLTLPTGRKGDPDTVDAADLTSYSSSWFHLDPTDDGIVFTANAGGTTTSGSRYPRSELRELDGGDHASWSNTSGTHTLAVRQAVTALPEAKPEVVVAQIHDSSSDVIEIRLEGSKLIGQYNDGQTDVTIDPDYTLGDVYDLQLVAADGRIQVLYNGVEKLDIAKKGSGWYFKSGCYLQSNTGKGDSAGAVASVVIYQLGVTHTG